MTQQIARSAGLLRSWAAVGSLLQQSGPCKSSSFVIHRDMSVLHRASRLTLGINCTSKTLSSPEVARCARNINAVRCLYSLPYSRWSSAKDRACTDAQQPSEKTFLERLQTVQQFLNLQIPEIMSSSHEYRMYTKDMIFENNWDASKPVRSVGVGAYVKSVVKARYYVHGHYAKVKVTILNSSIDEAAGAVRVHWQLTGLPQMKVFFMFWKFAPFRFKETAEKQSDHLEGISTFFVDKKGFICKHTLNRVISENEDKQQEVGA